MSTVAGNQPMRFVILGVAVILEGIAVISVVMGIALVPGALYGNVISVAVFVLPGVIGLLSRRLEVAILLAVLPFWALAVVFLAIDAPLWNVDLYSIGLIANRAAGPSVMLVVLASLGWLLRRLLFGRRATSVQI